MVYTQTMATHLKTESILSGFGITPTKQRIAILHVLISSRGPLSIDEIQKKVKGKANYVTLYRVLKLLVSTGIVYQTDFRDGKAYFEFHGDHHHHHIVCSQCGTREKTNDCHEQDDYDHVLRHSKRFKKITSHTLEFFGICTACS